MTWLRSPAAGVGFDAIKAAAIARSPADYCSPRRGTSTRRRGPGSPFGRSSTATSSDLTRRPPSWASRSTIWRVLAGIRLTRTAAWDETRERGDPEGRLLPPRDDAEAGNARDLVSFGRGNGGPPNRGPELRGGCRAK